MPTSVEGATLVFATLAWLHSCVAPHSHGSTVACAFNLRVDDLRGFDTGTSHTLECMSVPSDNSRAENNRVSHDLAHNAIPTSSIAGPTHEGQPPTFTGTQPGQYAGSNSSSSYNWPQPNPGIAAPKRYGGRIGGLDVARALAIFGMFYAHVAPFVDGSTAATLLDAIPDGRSSILFALLAGVSLSILTGRNIPYTGDEMRSARLRILSRAAMLIVLAGPVALLGTPIAIILAFYGAWFVAALPFASWGPRKLFLLAAGTALFGPVAVQLFIWFTTNLSMWGADDANGFIVDVFFTGMYPGAVYMAYVFAGMGIGRLNITERLTQAILTLSGTVLMIIGYGTSWVLTRVIAPPSGVYNESFDDDAWMEGHWAWQGYPLPHISEWIGIEPHTNTIFEAVGSGGFAIAVLGVCLLASRLARTVLYPVAAVGSMSLTAYTTHIVVIAFTNDWVGGESWKPIFWLVGGALLLCTLWKQLFRRGPLEWAMWKVSLKAAQLG